MTIKRSLELTVADSDQACLDDDNVLSNDDREPPTKRRMISVPHTPLPTRLSFPTPQTPFTGTPYPSRPLDSPTNPVGRKRTKVLAHSLPAPTSFSKHLPLRFQFVRPGVSPRMGGIYRIVQVPLSYTFVQLRCLIAFLFGGGYADEQEDRHLFELKKKIVMYAQTYKPGQIRSGYTANRLSSARDPCRYRPEVDEDSLWDDDESAKPKGEVEDVASEDTDEGEGEGEDPGWTWELEEEYTLGHAWSRGGDLTRGIIYHHNKTTAVHITLNTSSLPRRSGISNAPYLFQARGRVRLLPNSVRPLPKPLFSVPMSKLPAPSFRQSAWSTASPQEKNEDVDGESDPEYGDMSSSGLFSKDAVKVEDMSDSDDDEQDGEEDEAEDPNAMLSTKRFNKPKAFASYLRFVHQHSSRRQCSTSDESDTDDDNDASRSTPGLDHWASSPATSSPFASSSVHFSSSPLNAAGNHSRSTAYDLSAESLSTLSTLSAIAFTPAPPHAPWQRRRLERVQKRMEKYKRREWMRAGDDDDDEKEDGEDQLCDESNKEQRPPAEKKSEPHSWKSGNAAKVGSQKRHVRKTDPAKLPPLWVKPELKPGEVWDPFGDEIEV
ncbi:hypothetical protein D9615_004961 [Tricholomella constricta]|uniref:Uncharacterized protein n=1 Tax=Tricholomella constricta TaxID=117010 RepID=A0A8H5M724_9AGAR|nr:hypothetical protein D9615_004961 [Tricholomella constricta]